MKVRIFASIILLCISPFVHSQDILFSDDFNNCSLNEKWTFSLTGNQQVAWGVGLPTNPKANQTSINGSCMLYFDDDLTGDKTAAYTLRLESSVFNGAMYSDILFKAQVHFRRSKTESMRILIDNGKKEHVIREFKGANYSGDTFDKFINVSSDLSFIASDSMRIIIEYKDNGEWGWWAGIDNIQIEGKKDGKVVLGESFNDCSIPPGWSTEIVNGVDNWNFGLFTDGKSIDGTCFTWFNDDKLGKDAPLSKIRLFSPTFAATEYANYKLTYNFIFRTYVASEYLQLYVDNGKEWIPVKTYTSDFGGPQVDAAKIDSIDLSEFRNDSLRLIWEYNDGGWAWWLGFDNVKVTGRGSINDRCNKAIPIMPDGNCVPFDNSEALSSDELHVSSDGIGYLYYSLNALSPGSYQIKTSSIFNDRVEIFSGNCAIPVLKSKTNHDEYGFSGEEVFIQASEGENFIVRIAGEKAEFGLEKGLGCISLIPKTDITNSPPDDICTSAIPIFLNQPCTASRNIKANFQGPIPTKNTRSRADIWYSFIPDSAGTFVFESQADFADALAVFTGNCDTLTEVGSNFSGQSIEFTGSADNITYYIQVSGYFSILEGTLCGIVKRKVLQPEVLNENCLTALPLSMNANCSAVFSAAATFSGIRPDCEVYMDADVWFSFTAPSSGEVFLRAKADFEHNIAVYEGKCNALIPVFCQKNASHCAGYIHLERLKAGKIYFIQTGSLRSGTGFRTGNICIELLDQPPLWSKISLSVQQQCISKGAVLFTPTATGGRGLLTFDGEGLQIPVPGNQHYIIEAKDEDGCVDVMLVNAQSCNDFGCTLVSSLSKSNVTCYSGSDGLASLNIDGGLPPYGVKWSNGLNGASVNGLSAATYQITVSDGSGCELVEECIISQPANITSNPQITSPNCYNDSTGFIHLYVFGGNGPYSYHWEDGSSTDILTNVSGGDYNLTVTDATGCIISETITISQPDEISITADIENQTCPGLISGAISTFIKGGISPYELLWNNGSVTHDITNQPAGMYFLEIKDAHQCLKNDTFEILAPNDFALTVDSIDLILSNAKPAFISITFTGGTAPYDYQWFLNDAVVDVQTDDIEAITPGSYNVRVTDANGCIYLSENWLVERSSGVTSLFTENNIILFPNPVSGILHVRISNMKNPPVIRMMNIFGQYIDPEITYRSTDNTIDLDVSNIPSGNYILSCTSGTAIFTSKVIKYD